MPGPVSTFIDHHYRHFNAASLKDAANGYRAHLDGGGDDARADDASGWFAVSINFDRRRRQYYRRRCWRGGRLGQWSLLPVLRRGLRDQGRAAKER